MVLYTHSISPVSYTHLDVYKRQVLWILFTSKHGDAASLLERILQGVGMAIREAIANIKKSSSSSHKFIY